MARIFSIIGDSNVKRHMNSTNCRDRSVMGNAQVLICTKLAVFPQTIKSVRQESNVCLLSCVSNFLTDSNEASSSLSHRVDPILKQFFQVVTDACRSHPNRRFILCPPMYRRHPIWYRDGQGELLSRFSASYAEAATTVSNLHAIPGFATPGFESDGVHLTAYSGLEFVLHLFDRSEVLLSSLDSSSAVRESQSNESVRCLSDQLVALQQDHQRLSSAFETKSAVDAELACFRANERSEDSVLVSGLPRLPSGLTGKAWQDQARQSVEALLSDIAGHSVKALVVQNVTGRGPSAETSYSVRMENVEVAREIRKNFGHFFQGGSDSRPARFSKISISNVVTRETRVRIALLKILGKKYKDSNPGSRVQVIGYEPRPVLRLVPPPEASDKRPKTFTFIEAVTKLSSALVDDDLRDLASKASGQFGGRLRELFVILNDDMVPRSRSRPPKRGREGASEDEPPSRSSRADTE
jgi:hypothetical protein